MVNIKVLSTIHRAQGEGKSDTVPGPDETEMSIGAAGRMLFRLHSGHVMCGVCVWHMQFRVV